MKSCLTKLLLVTALAAVVAGTAIAPAAAADEPAPPPVSHAFSLTVFFLGVAAVIVPPATALIVPLSAAGAITTDKLLH